MVGPINSIPTSNTPSPRNPYEILGDMLHNAKIVQTKFKNVNAYYEDISVAQYHFNQDYAELVKNTPFMQKNHSEIKDCASLMNECCQDATFIQGSTNGAQITKHANDATPKLASLIQKLESMF